jgi:hypothetical protein
MKAYHRTFAATEILSGGFRDATGTYMADQEFTEVWVIFFLGAALMLQVSRISVVPVSI